MWLAIGKSKNDTAWKNKQFTWPELTERLKKPIITPETLAEYKLLPKEKQGKIKDVGGYVGGSIKGGHRLKGNIECRSLITLEGDEGCNDLWEMYQLYFDNATVLHSTHSSDKDNLRARLIIPLDRECFIDEYEAIVRKVAELIGMDYFDYTSFQPERLMFWPSVSKDAEYVFKEQKGTLLVVDNILGMYRDWNDISQWPLHPKENKKINSDKDKQENPLYKPGIIGAFCRTYNLREAIEKFLPDIYEATDIENRYTYKLGSTAAGVVVYDDLFSYSHHATDPTGGILCNAFDLVRLSLYGDEDKGIENNTPITKRPSFIKCCEFLAKDKEVKKAVVSEKIKDAKESFAEYEKDSGSSADMEEDVTKQDWYGKLETDKKGRVIYSTVNNIVLILQNDKKFKNIFKWDAFNHRMVLATSTYWKKINNANDTWIDDNDKANIRHYLEKMYGISGKDKINDALLIVANKNKFHPVLDYLATLKWDGVERLDTLLVDYLGASDIDYVRAVTRKCFVAAIARVKQPGIKYDTMLILVGKQGLGKSTLFDKMAGHWFSDNVGNLHDKSSMEQLRGVWVMEIGELAAMRKADIETVKSFLARREDKFRQAFGETLSNFSRQCIFVGTTNKDEFLIDTENRRFWPVVVCRKEANKSVFDLPHEEVNQLWAEALHYYNQKEPLILSRELTIIAEKIQEHHTEKESYLPFIQTYLHKNIPENWYDLTASERYAFLSGDQYSFEDKEKQVLVKRYKVSPVEIWIEALGGRKENYDRIRAKNIKNAMDKLKDWEYKKIKVDGLATWGWMLKDERK